MASKASIVVPNGGQVNLNTGNGTINVYNRMPTKRTIEEVSAQLRSWYHYVYGEKHIARTETSDLYSWVVGVRSSDKPKDRVALLVGDAGSGKSVVMRDLLEKLEEDKIPVLGIKSDILFSTKGELDAVIGFDQPTATIIREKANESLVVVLIDQIDALSSVLTSDRGSLRSINSLVDEVSKHPNVRVVVSCRPYDQQYDPSLERYSLGKRVVMTGLPEEEVEDTLNLVGIKISDNEREVKEFLQNPLNLFLFCRINNGSLFNKKRPNRTLLYEALWNQVVDSVQQTDLVCTQSLTNCLDRMTNDMYERQTLALPYARVYGLFSHEVNYLQSNNFVYGDSDNGNLQFIHQSLYDYIYARLFLSQGKTVDDILSGIHQGLFIRLRLKQVLFYLRDVDEDAYLDNLNELLFAEEDGKNKYRFHLKHLMLTNIGFLDNLLPREEYFLEHTVLINKDFASIYLDSVNTKVGLELYKRYVESKGGFQSLSTVEQLQFLSACDRTMYSDTICALNCLLQIDISHAVLEVQRRYGIIANRVPVSTTNADLLIRMVDKVAAETDGQTLDLALVNLVPFSPCYVRDWMVNYVKVLADRMGDQIGAREIDPSYHISHIYDTLKEKNPESAYEASLQIIQYVCEKSAYELETKSTIKTTRVFLCFQRNREYGHFVENLLTDLLDYYDTIAQGKPQKTAEQLQKLAVSNFDATVLIPTSSYRANITEYLDEAYELSKRIILDEPSSSVLKYHAKELFRVMFPLLSKKQKDDLMGILESYNPEWEKQVGRLYPNDPLTYIGYAKAEYYILLSKADIAKYPNAKKHLKEQMRVRRGLENHEPFHIESHSGWTTLGADVYEHLSVEELVKTMIEIKGNDHIDWEKPTKTGHALAIKQLIDARPDDVYEAYMKALDNKGLDLDYPLYGIEAFLKNGYETAKVDTLVEKILSRLDSVLKNNADSHLIQVARIVDNYYDQGQRIPQRLFEWVCRIAKEWDDSEYKTEEGDEKSYQEGINQVRGCAAEALLRCYQEQDRIDEVFDVLFEVAKSGAVPTRAAVLFRLGVLLHADKKRTINLFIAMMHDYSANLLALPLHNQNPLLYLINIDFPVLKPYFEACLKEPKSHKETVVLLWFAWLREINGAEELMFQMGDATEEARAALIQAIWNYYKPAYQEKTLPILYKYMDCDEKGTGGNYDRIFDGVIQQFDKVTREAFIRAYAKSKACGYASHYFTEYMGGLAKEEPRLCLELLPDLYAHNRNTNDWGCTPAKLIDYLITSYNAIKSFDKSDIVLELALDLMDEWLHENVNRQYLFNCFRLLDN